MQASSSPPDPASPAITSPWYARTSVLDILVSIGLIGLLLSAPAVYIADHVWSLHLTPVWEQVVGLFIATLLVVAALKGQHIGRTIRILCMLGALVILAAVIDSLDGKPDFLPFITLLLGGWAVGFAHTTSRIMHHRHRLSHIQWIGGLLGIAATIVYLSAAVYYLIRTFTVGPQLYDHHLLFGAGFLIAAILRSTATAAEKQVTESEAIST
jgi:hypothetical protein